MTSSQDIKPASLKDQGVIQHPNGSDGWLPAENFIPPSPIKQQASADAAPADAAPATTSRRSTIGPPSPSKRKPPVPTSRHTTTSALVNGAPATAPISDEDLQNRAVSANNNLTPRQRSKIAKSEAKDGRRISKVIKEEGRTEKQAVAIAINELEELQRLQKDVVKSEARAHANHSKSLFAFKKTEAAYINAKLRYETDLAELHSESDALETLKNSSKAASDKVQEKYAQINILRTTLAVDEREREVKLSDLKGPAVSGSAVKRSSSLWR